MIYFLMFFLAFWAGFSVRRANLCMVRATLELISRKPPKTIFFVLQAMVVALSITIPALVFFPDKISIIPSYNISWYLFAGACLYGFGASINGSCALGTLNQLMNGKAEFIATVIGMVIGFFVFLHVKDLFGFHRLNVVNTNDNHIFILIPLMFLVWGISLFQIKKFLNENEDSKLQKLKKYMTSPIARDFVGITIFGFCSGTLFLILGSPWDYTQFIQFVETNIFETSMIDAAIIPISITTIALITGICGASILSKDFKFDRGNPIEYLIKACAGILMGFSVGLIPGGNDTLILYGVPGLAFHAPVALLIMMCAIAAISYIGDKFRKFNLI